jgi:hypothetical protein
MAEQRDLAEKVSPSLDPSSTPSHTTDSLPDDLLAFHQFYSNSNDIPAVETFELTPSVYVANEARLQHLFPKFDYDAAHGKIIVWMTCGRHSCFTQGVEDKVREKLRLLARNLPQAQSETVHGIKIERDSGVTLKDGVSKLFPDAQFRYSGNGTYAKRPSLVFETTNAQTSSSVADKARKFVTQTKGHVRAVVCFDIQYGRKAQASTVSV